MTDDTITITREMLEEALQNCHWDVREKGFREHLAELELALFGPKKPRECWLAIDGQRLIDVSFETNAPQFIGYSDKAPAPGLQWRKFREVLE